MVRSLDNRIKNMLGYSIHFPFIGHSDGLHPLKALERITAQSKL